MVSLIHFLPGIGHLKLPGQTVVTLYIFSINYTIVSGEEAERAMERCPKETNYFSQNLICKHLKAKPDIVFATLPFP